jgi:hypothetical protein
MKTMKTLVSLEKSLVFTAILICFTAFLVVGLWGNKYAGLETE